MCTHVCVCVCTCMGACTLPPALSPLSLPTSQAPRGENSTSEHFPPKSGVQLLLGWLGSHWEALGSPSSALKTRAVGGCAYSCACPTHTPSSQNYSRFNPAHQALIFQFLLTGNCHHSAPAFSEMTPTGALVSRTWGKTITRRPLSAAKTNTLYLRLFRKQRHAHANGKCWIKKRSSCVTVDHLAGRGVTNCTAQRDI